MQYYNCELSLVNAELFRDFLLDNGIKFEIFAAGNLFRFEVLLDINTTQFIEVNDFLRNLPFLNV